MSQIIYIVQYKKPFNGGWIDVTRIIANEKQATQTAEEQSRRSGFPASVTTFQAVQRAIYHERKVTLKMGDEE